ncbi:MAG: hypothetical protein NVSMB38_39390 [Ktedonobacteraceae bacterium]
MQTLETFTTLQRGQVVPTNWLADLTSFVGHEQDITKALQLIHMADVRLLSIIGTGGVGKTRFSLQLTTYLASNFADGIFFIPLASIQNPNLVIATIAQVLEVVEDGEQPLLNLLKNFIGNKQLLLLLDNFEQVIGAAPQIAELVASCSRLKLIVTSREVLHVRSEHPFLLAPLALPSPKHVSDLSYLSGCAAVYLFVERVQAVKPGFILNKTNASIIAEICTHLDGLPLAIELAATRIRILSLQALLAQLERRLQVLTSGARDLPERQRTLRATMQWSYDLLTSEEQYLFRWLSIFAGGCTLQAVQSICANGTLNTERIIDGVMSLLDKSLLQRSNQQNDEPRFAMLETIREYGLECLDLNGEREMAHSAHAKYYLAFAQEAQRELSGTRQALWLEQLEREQGNLHMAYTWFIAQRIPSENIAKVLAVQKPMPATMTCPSLDAEILRESSKGPRLTLAPAEELTVREFAVLRFVAQGLTNVQIAEELVISSRTVNAHLRSIYKKLKTSSRIAITRYAIDNFIT